MTPKSLWGQIDTEMTLPAPVNILQDQAAMLEKITGGILSGDVQRSQDKSTFCATLEVVAPYLRSYRLGVVEIQYHPPEEYPVSVLDIIPDHPGNDRTFMPWTTCEDEKQFLQRLGEILGKPRLRKILSSLVSHSQAERSDTQPSVATSQ